MIDNDFAVCDFYNKTEGKDVYVGIADNLGVESFIPIDNANLNNLYMRAFANPHRQAVVYMIELNKKEFGFISQSLKSSNYKTAVKQMKYFASNNNRHRDFKPCEMIVSNNSYWKSIPNNI